MKKLIVILILASVVLAQPILSPEPVIDKEIKKIDDKTLELKTTTTTVNVQLHDKAELQTELDHIPDRRAALQEQMDALDEREAELMKMLEIFK